MKNRKEYCNQRTTRLRFHTVKKARSSSRSGFGFSEDITLSDYGDRRILRHLFSFRVQEGRCLRDGQLVKEIITSVNRRAVKKAASLSRNVDFPDSGYPGLRFFSGVFCRWRIHNENGRTLKVRPLASSGLWYRLAGRHPDRPIKADIFAVEIPVPAHFHGEGGVFLGITQSGRVGNLSAERLLHIVRRALKQRCVEDAGQDGVDADMLPGEVSGDW